LNLSDIDLEKNTISLSLPDTHLVGKINLVQTYTTYIDAQTREVLQTYIDYERKPVVDDGVRPLFTTTHGRVSTATFRRSIRQANEAIDTYSLPDPACSESKSVRSGSEERDGNIYPSDLWKYSISRVIN